MCDFGKHPSKKLQELFAERPFQIQSPEKAKIIFLGLDANLDKDIEKDEAFFNEMLEYLKDGVKYWKENGYHTPMLKKNFKGAGKRYHSQFCKLGFTSNNAGDICFLELLKFCTFGRSTENPKKFFEMLHDKENKTHLEWIKDIFGMENKICTSKSVKRVVDKLELFDTNNDKKIILHTHFAGAVFNKDLHNLGKELLKFIS